MKSTFGIVITCVAMAGMSWVAFSMWNRASLTAKESGQRALMREAWTLLRLEHDVTGNYPDTLLGLPFTYPDGATQRTLQDIKYRVDGETFLLEATGYQSGTLIRYTEQTEPGG